MKIDRDAPIGVFDSGVGGLTVAREIMRKRLFILVIQPEFHTAVNPEIRLFATPDRSFIF